MLDPKEGFDKFDIAAEYHNAPEKLGAPPKPIDIEDFRKLCVLQCTEDEIAGFFAVSTRTIKRRLKEDLYRAAWDEGRAAGRISLRRKMWATAAGGGSSAGRMQEHLSKHWLGMTDKAAEIQVNAQLNQQALQAPVTIENKIVVMLKIGDDTAMPMRPAPQLGGHTGTIDHDDCDDDDRVPSPLALSETD